MLESTSSTVDAAIGGLYMATLLASTVTLTSPVADAETVFRQVGLDFETIAPTSFGVIN